MVNPKLGVRVILALIAVLGLGLVSLTYLGDSLSLNGLVHCLPQSRGYGDLTPEARQAYLQANFQRMYDLWGYVRYGGIALVVLAILGLKKSWQEPR